jgi:glutaredoxin
MEKLRIFTTPWCPDCKNAKRVLEEHAIDYEEIDIEKHPEFVDHITKKRGKKVVPTLEFNGKTMDGNHFDEKKFRRELKDLLSV